MKHDLIQLPFKHSKGLPIGIDIFPLEELYKRARAMKHDLTDPYRLGFYALLYVTSGEGKHFVDFHPYHASPDTLIIISKNQVNQYAHGFPLQGYLILITEEFVYRSLFDLEGTLTRLLFDPITTHAYCLNNARSTLVHIEHLVEEYSQETPPPEHVPILVRELGLLLLKADRLRRTQLSEKDQQAESSPRLLAFRELLQRHVKDHWTTQQYADALNFSKRTLSSLTRKHLNRSPKEIIDQRLLLEVKRLLPYSELSIKEIAYQLGFEDPSNMTKFFKRMQGNTPKEFRESTGASS